MFSLVIYELNGDSSITKLIKEQALDNPDLIDEVIVLSDNISGNYNSIIKNAVKKAKNELCIVIPTAMVPSDKFIRYIAECYKNDSKRVDVRLVMLGLHDNKCVSIADVKDPIENYSLYTVYNKTPSENDFEYAFAVSKRTLDNLSDEFTSHYALRDLYKKIRLDNKNIAYIVNERLYHNTDSIINMQFKRALTADFNRAQEQEVIPVLKLSAEQKRHSIVYFEKHLVITLLGHSFKIKFKPLPVFPKKAISYKEVCPVATDRHFIHKRACIFAAFTNNGIVRDNSLRYLQSLKAHCDYIVYVADSKILISEVEKLKKYCDSIIVKRHEEYDFGSYKRGFNLLKKHHILDRCESLLLCNDSVDYIGNETQLSDIFEKSKNFDAFSLCIASYGFGKRIRRHQYEWIKYPHLQSYFVVLKNRAFMTGWMFDFMDSIKKLKNKRQIIIKYEMGFSGLLREHGMKLGSYYPYDESNIVNPYAIYLNRYTKNPLFIKHMLEK